LDFGCPARKLPWSVPPIKAAPHRSRRWQLHLSHGRKIAVIGLGYVGLPVAVAFARSGVPVIGFDIGSERVRELQCGRDRTREVDPADLRQPALRVTADAADLGAADFFIVTVPTPIDEARRPDLRPLLSASELVGKALRNGAIVVFESTVYPGATEEDCIPVLERASGLRAGSDFTVGYSPERINPGDMEHRFETIRKVVAGQDQRTLEIIAAVYGSVVKAEIHRAPSIRVAEAAKVIENTQRDLNIALMNELSAICHLLGIDTADVLAAAQTKWNFLPFTPGLVGGHCVGVDPYYLTARAEKAGYHPEVILAGRRINDGVGARVARECLRFLMRNGSSSRLVTILGLTFKENVPDIRNSKVKDILAELNAFGASVQVHDPLAAAGEVRREFGIELAASDDLAPADVIILAVPHEAYLAEGWPFLVRLLKNGRGIVMDLKARLDRARAPSGIELWRL
jgi:UDP-N-acetyl-D-glucosamine/UDP-N-acetyl-D-galactosamine dehydrogenase